MSAAPEDPRASDAMVTEGVALVQAAETRGLTLRLLGGAAISLRVGRMHRPIGDVDLVVRRSGARELAAVFAERGYTPEARFNALHGDRRLIFKGPAGKVDVFVGAFEMCHRLELDERLVLDSPTLTVSDLLLTKLQVVELNAKDAYDAALLLAEHELREGPGDHIDTDYISSLAGDDWGLWRTISGTLERVGELEREAADKAGELLRRLERVPKSRRFRLRAKVGERKRWYELPDEVG